MLKSVQELYERCNVTADEWTAADYPFDALCQVLADHEARLATLRTAMDHILADLRECEEIHATRGRIKKPTALAEKIVRKRGEALRDGKPVRAFSLDSYRDECRDLIGVRAMHLNKAQWTRIHHFIVDRFDVVEVIYYHHRGDTFDDAALASLEQLKVRREPHEKGYRSVHYIVVAPVTSRSRYFAEIQVRTVAQDLWSETDHLMRYTDGSADARIEAGLDLLNLSTNLADEASTFVASLGEWLGDHQAQLEQKESLLADALAALQRLEGDRKLSQEEIAALREKVKRLAMPEPSGPGFPSLESFSRRGMQRRGFLGSADLNEFGLLGSGKLDGRATSDLEFFENLKRDASGIEAVKDVLVKIDGFKGAEDRFTSILHPLRTSVVDSQAGMKTCPRCRKMWIALLGTTCPHCHAE